MKEITWVYIYTIEILILSANKILSSTEMNVECQEVSSIGYTHMFHGITITNIYFLHNVQLFFKVPKTHFFTFMSLVSEFS